jgi:hypothetical protein
MPAIGTFGPGNGVLRRRDTHPEVTHTHGIASAFVQLDISTAMYQPRDKNSMWYNHRCHKDKI